MDWETQDKLDDQHARHPKPGDYWHEMCTPILVVLAVSRSVVVFCEKTRDTDASHWTWDLRSKSELDRKQFRRKLQYQTIDGYWCHVLPEHHKWAAEHCNLKLLGQHT